MPRLAPLLALALLLPSFAVAAPSAPFAVPLPSDALAWTNEHGPAGGPASGIAGSADVLVLSLWGDLGTYRSADNGLRWQRIPGFPAVSEGPAAFDPDNPPRGYVAGYGGVARTLDGGVTWDHVLASYAVDDLAIAPGGRVAVAARDEGFNTRILVSDDAGGSWQDWNAPFPAFTWLQGARFGRTASELVVSTSSRTWVTHDAGATWPDQPGGVLEMARTADGGLWRVGFGDFERSVDGGLTWQPVSAPALPRAMAAAPWGLWALTGAGVLRTMDDGQTWENLGFAEPTFGVTSALSDPRDPGALWMSDEFVGALRLSRDGGDWALEGRTSGLAPVDLDSLAAGDGLLLAGGSRGVYASRDGMNWTHTGGAMGVQSVYALGVGNRSVLYAGGQLYIFWPFLTVSHDGGRTWEAGAYEVLGDGAVVGFAVDHRDPLHAFAAVWGELADSQVLETHDGGRTWATLVRMPENVWDVAWHAQTNTLLIAHDLGLDALTELPTGGRLSQRVVARGMAAAASDGTDAIGVGQTGSVWRSVLGLPVFTEWAPGSRETWDAAAAGGEAWVLGRSQVWRCAGDLLQGQCAEDSPPSGFLTSIVRSGDRVFAGSRGAGLWQAPVA